MDEYFQYFLEENGPAADRREVPQESIDRYRGLLPDQLLAYWQEHGWAAYDKRRFWTVNPDDYEPVLDAWLSGTELEGRDRYYVIARGAFGDLFVWGEHQHYALTIFSIGGSCNILPCPKVGADPNAEVRYFFASMSPGRGDFDDKADEAAARLGPLNHNEIYGFVPALALGGSTDAQSLRKVRAVEHLLFLAQLQPLEFQVIPSLA